MRTRIGLSDLALAIGRLCPNKAGLDAIATMLLLELQATAVIAAAEVVARPKTESTKGGQATRSMERKLPQEKKNKDKKEREKGETRRSVEVEIVNEGRRDVALPRLVKEARALPRGSFELFPRVKPRALLGAEQARYFIWEVVGQKIAGGEIDTEFVIDRISLGVVPEIETASAEECSQWNRGVDR
jgi:hypothetical protein